MSTEQINTVEEVKNIVTETVPETVPAVETAEAVEETVTEVVEEKKTKSFFSIFKKDKVEEVEAPVAEATETVEGEAAAVVDEATEAAVTEEVPVETAPAKKGRLCGLCAFGKKSETTEEAAAATEETAAATEETAAATEEAAVTEEAAPVTDEAPVVEEEEAAPVVAAAVVADEAAAETTEGEAVAPVVEADVVRSGILFKSGKFFKTNLNERHCRLLSTGVFQWSKTDDFTKAHECKVDAETTTVAFMAEGEDAVHKYRFELHCCGSVSTYAVDTEEDRDEWIRAFETVKESIVPAAVEAEPVAEVAEEAPVAETPAE